MDRQRIFLEDQDLNGQVVSDTFLLWINNEKFPVQNPENIQEPGTREELDWFFPEDLIATLESILNSELNMNSLNTNSFESNTFSEMEELGYFFPEEFINLATLELYLNSFNIDPQYFQNHTIFYPISDTTSPLSVPESPTDDFLALLEDLEKSEANSRKRSLEVKEVSNDPAEAPVSKKKRLPSNSSTHAGAASDKIVERRIKNNAASRNCRASRKARHNKLFEQEKELLEENKELTSKVKELTAEVNLLKELCGQYFKVAISQ